MSTSAPMTNAQAAQLIARLLGPVVPLCYTDAVDGQPVCVCGGAYDRDSKMLVPHTGHDLGKAPISALVRNGVDDATKNSATIDRWWRTHPRANVGLALKPAVIVFVDPDSPAAYAEAIAQGVEGGMLRSSRNDGFLFKRPTDWPVINISKSADKTDLEIRADGYAVVWGTHVNGTPVRIDLDAKLEYALSWIGDRLKAKAATKAEQDAIRAARRTERANGAVGSDPPVRLHQRGMRRWTGELVQRKQNGDIDQSDSLYFIGLDLAECGASEASVRWGVENRDVELGWRKYADRNDADERYQEIAERTVAYVIEQEQAPQLKVSTKAPTDGSLDEVIEFAEMTAAENARLRRVIQDQGDRLEILEPMVNQIDEIMARPEEELDDAGEVVRYGPTSNEKLFLILMARWNPHHRARRQAKGEHPTLSLGYVGKLLGMSDKRVAKCIDRWASDDAQSGAPIRKAYRKKPLFDRDGVPICNPKTGVQIDVREIEVIPWQTSPAETLRAGAAYAMPAKPKHGGSQAASAARWGECPKHDNQEVRVKGYCPDCGKIVGETLVSRADFDLLPNVQVGYLEGEASDSVGSNSIRVQVGCLESDDALAAAMVQTPLLRDTVDKHKQYTPKPENLGPLLISDYRSTPDDVDVVPEEAAWLREWPDDPPPAVTCTRCSEPVAPGHKLYCIAHVADADQVVMPWERPAAMAGAEE